MEIIDLPYYVSYSNTLWFLFLNINVSSHCSPIKPPHLLFCLIVCFLWPAWVGFINLYWKKMVCVVYSEGWKCNRWLWVALSASSCFHSCIHSFHVMKGHKQWSWWASNMEGKVAQHKDTFFSLQNNTNKALTLLLIGIYTYVLFYLEKKNKNKQWLNVCNMIICCFEGLCELDQKEWWGSHAAGPGTDEPSAVFCRVCPGLYLSQYSLSSHMNALPKWKCCFVPYMIS